jgi:hypothetical protein
MKIPLSFLRPERQRGAVVCNKEGGLVVRVFHDLVVILVDGALTHVEAYPAKLTLDLNDEGNFDRVVRECAERTGRSVAELLDLLEDYDALRSEVDRDRLPDDPAARLGLLVAKLSS